MRALAFMAALGIAASLLRSAGADVGVLYPIWFHPSLGIESVADVGGTLEETTIKYDDDSDDGRDIKMVLIVHEQFPVVVVQNCAELVSADHRGYWPVGWIDTTGLHYAENYPTRDWLNYKLWRCRNIAALGGARPARRSHLRGYFHERTATEELRNLFCEADGLEDVYGEIVTEELVFWCNGVFHPSGTRHHMRIQLLSMADFDGDGLEDALVSAIESRSLPLSSIHRWGGTYLLIRETENDAVHASFLHGSY